MKRSIVAATTAILAGIVMIAWVRGPLFEAERRVKTQTSVYTLPAPAVLNALSLGYRAALADYLWAHILVTQGLRLSERRPFPEIGDYMDAINSLDPKFREPYRLVDSIMTFQANDPDRETTIARVRAILERGLSTFPLDAELWINYGQFLAYIAPGSLKDSEMAKWREDGARALVRAGELGGHDQVWAYRTLSAASILSKKGERDAAIRFLERAYALTEDESLQQDLLRRLSVLHKGEQRSRMVEFTQRFDQLWKADVPFASRAALSVFGPPTTVWECAGRPDSKVGDAGCYANWSAWSERGMPDDRQR